MDTIVVHHRADYDGLFCREIAKKFLPEGTQFIGWDFGDKTLAIPGSDTTVYVLDLPVDQVFNFPADTLKLYKDSWLSRVVWIDHHKTAIESHPNWISGWRIDGVAACRIAWQYFNMQPQFQHLVPPKSLFVNRELAEPHAVRLAGEYDIADERDPDALTFQYGLDAQKDIPWSRLLRPDSDLFADTVHIIEDGKKAQKCFATRDAAMVKDRSFIVEWEGLKFLTLTIARCTSTTFTVLDKPETGHDALMGFFYTGKEWRFSLYHAKHKKDIDLSAIAKKYGGGGHRGACGFKLDKIPFIK